MYGDEDGVVAPLLGRTATNADPSTDAGARDTNQGAQSSDGVTVPMDTTRAPSSSHTHETRTNTAAALANQRAPNMQPGLPSGTHYDPAILALPVQPHQAKGPCWRCKDRCKECNWQHPMEHCHLKRTSRPKHAAEQMKHCPHCHNTGYHTNNCPYHKSNNCPRCRMRGGSHLSHCPNRGSQPPQPPVLTGLQPLSALKPMPDEPSPDDGSEDDDGDCPMTRIMSRQGQRVGNEGSNIHDLISFAEVV